MSTPIRGRPIPGMEVGPAARPRDFRSGAIRLLARLGARRGSLAAIAALAVGGVLTSVTGPRILGHATDLLFAGIIGRRLPSGITRQQAIEAARGRGDTAFAELLTRSKVSPGVGVDFGAVGRTLLLAAGLYVVAALMVWAQGRLVTVAVQRTITALRSDVEDTVHRLPLAALDGRRRGELLSRATNDIDNVSTALFTTINQTLTSLLTLVAVLVMMLTISPELALAIVVTVPLSLVVTRFVARRAQRLFAAQWAHTGRLNAHLEETYGALDLVTTFGQSARAREQFQACNQDLYRAGFGAQFFSGLASPITLFVGNLGYVVVAVLGGLQVATGQITIGNVQALLQYVRQFSWPLSQVAALYSAAQSGVASAERVFAVLDEPPEPPDVDRNLPEPIGPTGARVEFRHVGFGYRAGVTVLEDLSLVAEPGQTVAIVGPTGAGKTTLVNLLMRFYDPDSGQILLDRVDIATVSRRSLRSRIGTVPQEPWLFNGTIRDNIRYGRPGATNQEIAAAATAACLDRFVGTLPRGYLTPVGGDVTTLSAGFAQLITIARTFLACPPVLVLDEATSSVDTRTEVLIRRAMGELRRDRTSFVIAHRLSTIRDADVIVVIDAGRIIEQGSHDELLDRHGAYFAMTRGQRLPSR